MEFYTFCNFSVFSFERRATDLTAVGCSYLSRCADSLRGRSQARKLRSAASNLASDAREERSSLTIPKMVHPVVDRESRIQFPNSNKQTVGWCCLAAWHARQSGHGQGAGARRERPGTTAERLAIASTSHSINGSEDAKSNLDKLYIVHPNP